MLESAKQYTTSIGTTGYLSLPSEPAHLVSPIETLPSELLYRIATFIPANSITTRECNIPDRFQLALVTKRFNGACTPLLYEYVFLDSYKQLFRFHLSAGVTRESWRTISLVVSYTALFEPRRLLPRDTTWSDLLFPLTQMRSLRQFVLDRSGENCKHFDLEHPVLNCLVSHAPNLSFFPNLSSLEIPYYPSLLSLCRGRPLTSVILGSSPPPISGKSFDEFVSGLGEIKSCLEEISLTVPAGTQAEVSSRIHQIVSLCPRPQAVTLRLPASFLPEWESDTLEATLMAWVEATLAPWTQLTRLSVRVSTFISVPMRIQEAIIRGLVKVMPKLKYVALPIEQCEWIRASSYDGIPEWTPRPDLGIESIN
ncbi:hypothetical protein FRC12_020112, partial [Ceratobasidium sp. 428]